MKKLTKKSLDELAKEMPIIDETYQKTFIGGTYYYDIASGTFFGQIGSSDDVRFVNSSEYEMCQNLNAEHYGSTFVSVSSGTQAAYIKNFFGGTGNIIISSTTNTDVAGLTASGNLVINPNSSVWVNKNDTSSTLYHEMIHYNANDYTINPNDQNSINQAEFTAFMAQISTAEYQNTSASYKKNTADLLYSYSQALGKPYSKATIYNMCGVTL